MDWYWIVLIVIGYILIGIPVAVILLKIVKEGKSIDIFDGSIAFSVWPIILAILIIVTPFLFIGSFVKGIYDKKIKK